MTRPARRPANHRITRRMALAHRAHATAPHLGCVLCMTGGVAGR
jgi:hypothetical protein